MNKMELRIGDIVQLRPDTVGNKGFGACFMIVTEPKSWGAQGFVQALGTREQMGGRAYYRAKWSEMDGPVGRTFWMPVDEEIERKP